jgi:hypothetical protein
MAPQSDVVFRFGSESGSYAALLLFTTMFAALGMVCARALRRRGRVGPRTAALAGAALFIVPVALVYGSSLNGFYRATLSGDEIVLRYLPGWNEHAACRDLSNVEAIPAFKGRWRLRILLASGGTRVSATSGRDQVRAQAREMGQHLSATPACR